MRLTSLGWTTEVVAVRRRYPANLCLFFGCVEFASYREDLGKPGGETVQAAARSAIGQVTSVHLRYVLSGQQRVNHGVQAGAGGDLRCGLWRQATRWRVGQAECE